MSDMVLSPSPSPPPPGHGHGGAADGRSSSSASRAMTATGSDDLEASSADNPPPSPSSTSQSEEEDREEDFATSTGNFRRNTIQAAAAPSSSSKVAASEPQQGYNEDPASPANLPHEILVHIFKFILTRTTGHAHLRNCIMVCRSWSLCGVELLWHRPAFLHLSSLFKLINVVRRSDLTFPYVIFIRRLNFTGIASELTDTLFMYMADCSRLERLAIQDCSNLSDAAIGYVLGHLKNLVSVDLSNLPNVTDETLQAIASNCKRLQGVNLTNCKLITSKGVAALGSSCPLLRRVKLCGCERVADAGLYPMILNCPMLLEIDVFQCSAISDESVRQIWLSSSHVRELRLAQCGPLTDMAFPAPARQLTNVRAALDLDQEEERRGHATAAAQLGIHGSESAPTSRGASPAAGVGSGSGSLARASLTSSAARLAAGGMASSLLGPLRPPKAFEHLRVLDLTNCSTISDDAIEGIISCAPRIRNLVLSKCTRLTDESVYSISRLRKNLQYLHLGHVSNVTDRSIKHLVNHCTRLRYFDLACCSQLTDAAVEELAARLPKLKRIGLVRVTQITDRAIYALVDRYLTLQRIHLSYCVNISIVSVFYLLERLPKVTHISLTGVDSFRRPDLQGMCRAPPEEFSAPQRENFCVYSGHGVVELQRFLRRVFESEERARGFLRGPAPPSASPRGGAAGGGGGGVGDDTGATPGQGGVAGVVGDGMDAQPLTLNAAQGPIQHQHPAHHHQHHPNFAGATGGSSSSGVSDENIRRAVRLVADNNERAAHERKLHFNRAMLASQQHHQQATQGAEAGPSISTGVRRGLPLYAATPQGYQSGSGAGVIMSMGPRGSFVDENGVPFDPAMQAAMRQNEMRGMGGQEQGFLSHHLSRRGLQQQQQEGHGGVYRRFDRHGGGGGLEDTFVESSMGMRPRTGGSEPLPASVEAGQAGQPHWSPFAGEGGREPGKVWMWEPTSVATSGSGSGSRRAGQAYEQQQQQLATMHPAAQAWYDAPGEMPMGMASRSGVESAPRWPHHTTSTSMGRAPATSLPPLQQQQQQQDTRSYASSSSSSATPNRYPPTISHERAVNTTTGGRSATLDAQGQGRAGSIAGSTSPFTLPPLDPVTYRSSSAGGMRGAGEAHAHAPRLALPTMGSSLGPPRSQMGSLGASSDSPSVPVARQASPMHQDEDDEAEGEGEGWDGDDGVR
ncbi:RNI-like protein [Jaminaea rosea]|uniref:RNI-like protein n=1 Tax=Jaminaea rosea TaxID=1569628 RepID=A0A316UMY4_9BASI|nr:RNI-like protein [Jaminaea rosea]PWN26647.1 RNI-like protein [Jaminaea rosea]